MMDEDGLPIVGSGVDLTKVPAIQQRRSVAVLNQFIVHTVCFLNRFSTVCEEKLAAISLRIQQIETTLSILEAKLSSIPGLEEVTVDQRLSTETAVGPESTATSTASSPPSEVSAQGQNIHEKKAEPENMTVANDPQYARYVKMVQVGVPIMAIKNKMVLEGLNPNLLDTPDAFVEDGEKTVVEEQDSSSDTESSFSD